MFALLHTPPDLAPWIQCIWSLRADGSAAPEPPIAPDGCCEWIIHVGEPPLMRDASGWTRQPRQFLFGQLRHALWLHADRPMQLLAVRLRAHAAPALLGIAGHALSSEPLDDVAPLRLPWHDAPTLELAYAWAVARLRALAGQAQRFDPLVQAACAALERDPALRMATLAASLEVSLRTLERRFTAGCGLAPKPYARIQRMQQGLRQLASPGASAAQVAHACGYADQAHLTRELQALAGLAPRDVQEKWRG